MSFQPGANLYTAGFGNRPENVEVPHIDTRDPSPMDLNYPIGKSWLNTVSNEEFILFKFQVISGISQAVWSSPVGITGAVVSLSGETGGVVLPDGAGNIQLIGTENQIYTISNSGSHDIQIGITDPLFVGGFNSTGPVNLATTTDEDVNIGNPASGTQVINVITNGMINIDTDLTINIGLTQDCDVNIGNPISVDQIINIDTNGIVNIETDDTVNIVFAADGVVNIGNPTSILQSINIDNSNEINIMRNGTGSELFIGSEFSNALIYCDTEVQGILSCTNPDGLDHSMTLVDVALSMTSPNKIVTTGTFNTAGCEPVVECRPVAACTVNLSSDYFQGAIIIVYDSLGSAGGNNVTIAAPIGGSVLRANQAPAASFVMSTNYQSVTFLRIPDTVPGDFLILNLS